MTTDGFSNTRRYLAGSGMTTCADTGYTATSPASNIFSDY
jgi:hypothetical protein